MVYDDDNVKKCYNRFDKLVSVNEDVEIDQIVTRQYSPVIHNQLTMGVTIYESENSDVTYCDEPGTRKLGTITLPMTNTTGDKNRAVEVYVRFGDTEFFVTCKDVTTGVIASASYDFL